MTETKYQRNTKEPDAERSTEDIRQDIAKEKENISKTVEQIGELIKKDLDWREYVKDSPYLAIGIAAGLGYLTSGIFRTSTTPMERIMDSIEEKVHDSLGGLHIRSAGPGLIKITLLGIAAQAASSWIKNATSTTSAKDGAGPRPPAGDDATMRPKMDAPIATT